MMWRWLVRRKDGEGEEIELAEPSWYLAKEHGSSMLGCCPDRLIIERIEDDGDEEAKQVG